MQVLPINKSFAPSFGEIKCRGNSSEKQIELDWQIKTYLRTPNKDCNNKTPEKYYEQKGFDIGITSMPNGNTVNVSLYKRDKKTKNLDHQSFFLRKEINIGDYSNPEELNAKEIKDKYEASRSFFYNHSKILSVAAAVILVAGLSQIKGTKAAALQTSEKVSVTMDSIYNKLTNILIKQK